MSRDLIARYWKAQDPYDPETLAACRHPKWTAEWPQSGERIASHENDVAINQNYPGFPRHELEGARGESERWTITPLFTPLRVEGLGQLWIGEARLQYPDQGLYHSVAILELQDDLVFRETVYFAQSLDPAEWRKDLAEPVAEQPGPQGWEDTIRTLPQGGDEQTHEAAIRKMFDAATSGRDVEDRRRRYADAIRAAFDPDGEEVLVASGERIRGLDRILARVERHPDLPTEGRLRRILGSGDLSVLEARLVYQSGPFWEAVVYSFRGGRIASARQYFAAEFDPPEWRKQWVERI